MTKRTNTQTIKSKSGIAKKSGTTVTSNTGAKVWKIFHFKERYELPDDIKICRKSSLQYIKLFVGISAGDEARGYQQQMTMICNGDGRYNNEIKGLYNELVIMAGEHSYAKRGYLLDAADQPLTSSQIAKLLNYPPATMRKMLAKYESVKLLEKVDLPEFDLSKNETSKYDNSKQRDSKKQDTRGQKHKRSGTFRNVPENSEKKGKPLKENQNGIIKRKREKEKLNKTDLNITKKTNPIGNLNKTKIKKNSKTQPQMSIKSVETENVNDEQALSTKTEIHKQTQELKPVNPMESEATAASSHHVPKQPSSAFKQGDPQHIGRIISGRFPEHWQDPDAEAFGWEIVEALGMSTDRENQQSRAEWGSFASWWSRVKQAAPTVAIEELRADAIKKAEYVHTKAKSARNKSAVWFKIMRGELLSRGIALPDSRASPAFNVNRCKVGRPRQIK